jgi:hypothetical protein
LASSRSSRRAPEHAGTTPSLLGGFGGQVKAGELASAWSFAWRLGRRDTVLFLPWHEYFPTPFTDHQVMVNPAAAQGRSGPTP